MWWRQQEWDSISIKFKFWMGCPTSLMSSVTFQAGYLHQIHMEIKAGEKGIIWMPHSLKWELEQPLPPLSKEFCENWDTSFSVQFATKAVRDLLKFWGTRVTHNPPVDWKPLSLSLARLRAEGQPPDLVIAQTDAVTGVFQPHSSIGKLQITCKLFSIWKFLFHLQGTADVLGGSHRGSLGLVFSFVTPSLCDL